MTYDLVIIGGGPAGVAAGVYAARKKIKTVLVTDIFGGQSLVSDDIQNWIGEAHVSGFDLAQKMEKHLKAQEGIEIVEGDFVESVVPKGKTFSVRTKNGKDLETKTVLLTAGSRRKKLEVPGEKDFEGKGVFYCATCDAPLMKGKIAAVVGGGNSGLEAVEDLLPYASKVYLLHRRDTLKGDAVTQEKIKADPKVEIIYNAETQKVSGNEYVSGLEYRDSVSGETKKLAVEGIFVEIGIIPNGDIVKDIVSLNFRGEVIADPKTQATSCVGIWAAGDATDGLYRQNNISAGDAVKAVLNIYDFLRKS
jgi:alkyl hydroperoxide reductase subunit F